ncbi:hypothetical protein I4U23_016499 [Adineta vaga]|nr:hypothetical protein I4U23_016499 [Adineta vaga]
MKKVNTLTIIFTILSILVGIIAVILFIVGVASRKWIEISSDLIPLETQISQVLGNSTFIASLIVATKASQAQVVQIVLATGNKVKEQLGNAAANDTTYHLYGKNPNIPETSPSFKTTQGFVFAGIASIFIGLLLSLIVIASCLTRIIRFVPLFFLTVGPILITIGYVIYSKLVIEDFGKSLEISVDVGFSIILIIISSIVGYVSAIIFALIILQPRQNPKINNYNNNNNNNGFAPRSMFRPRPYRSTMGRKM